MGAWPSCAECDACDMAGQFRPKKDLTIEYFIWARGEIGRRTRFRIWRSNAWGFDSLRAHSLIQLD